MTSAGELLPAGAPRIGLGCGDIYAGAHEDHSQRLVRTAFDSGVRYFDVARLYGNGEAEQVLGRAFSGIRDQVVIASKAGIVPWSMQTGTRIRRKALGLARKFAPFLPQPPPAVERYGAFSAAEITRSVEASLKALGTEYLDLLLLHECDVPEATRGETLSLLERLRTEGKVRAIGIATRFPETQAILQAVGDRLAVAQFPSDVFSRNEAALPPGWNGLVVTHSILKRGLAALREQVAADPARAAEWTARFGETDPADLLLQDALAAHAGLVLFTTAKPERIPHAVEVASAPDAAARAASFRDFLETTGVKAAA